MSIKHKLAISFFCCIAFVGTSYSQVIPTTITTGTFNTTVEGVYPAYGTMDLNYVRTWLARGPEKVTTTVNSATPVANFSQSIEYIDGIGRTLQQVNKGSSPSEKDVVKPIHYDQYGRQPIDYLPYIATTDNGSFHTSPFSEQFTYLQGQYSSQGEQFFYSKKLFEASPLNRVTTSMAPGNSWVGSSKGIGMTYEINEANEVRLWKINITSGSVPTSTGYYDAATLYRNVTTDEHGKKVVEYTDKSGKVVLKKVQIDNTVNVISETGWLRTYYIYDVLGALRCVISPKASDLIIGGTISSDILDELCFVYEYDARGRMATKKVPGAGVVTMLYDQRDRLVFTQDGKQAVSNKWMVTLYDVVNRPVITGMITATKQELESILNQTGYNFEPDDRTPTEIQASTNRADLVVSIREEGRARYEASQSIEFISDFTSEDGADFEAEIKHVAQNSTTLLVAGNPIPANANFIALTQTFYDQYAFTPKSYNNTDNAKLKVLNGFPEDLPDTRSLITRGSVTGTKVWAMEDPNDLANGRWLETVSFYDDKSRAVQVQADNLSGSMETASSLYSFSGQVLCTYQVHRNLAGSAGVLRIRTQMEYDNAGRLLTIKKRFNDDINTAKTLVVNEYDELGQLKNKKLGADPYNTSSPLETLAYDYNVRGWLKGINQDYVNNGFNNNYFGQTLSYDYGFSATQLNGNITGSKWRSKGDGEQRAYGYSYDNANRLLKADFTQNNGGWTNTKFNFDMQMGDGVSHASAYDANGNIKAMQQKGWKLGEPVDFTIDNFTYNYKNNEASNRLLAVTESSAIGITDNKLGDFTDKNRTQDDYDYDQNGNLLYDKNKSIASIVYNHLNLPALITVTGKGSIQYVYDATGNKHKKITTDNTVAGKTITTTTSYIGQFVYESKKTITADPNNPDYTEALQFFGHEEGRVRIKPKTDGTKEFVCDYFLKDHLGNVRAVITDEVQQNIYPAATLETGKIGLEKSYYTIDDNTSHGLIVDKHTTVADYQNNNGIDNPPVNQTFDNANSAKVYKLGSSTSRTGLGITLKVMAGDKINIFGRSYYLQGGNGNETPLDPLDIINGLLLTPTGVTAGKGTTAQILAPSTGTYGQIDNWLNEQVTNNKPKAFINYIILDEQFKFVKGDFSATGDVTNTAYQHYGNTNMQNIVVPKNGYIYVYCSNESDIPVFFDNLQVVHTKGQLLEETHYYPFGLTMAEISSRAHYINVNKSQYASREFQSLEFSNGSGLDAYDFRARYYDPQIGKFFTIDPLANVMRAWSPYNYAFNNPTRFADGDGMAPGDSTVQKTGNVIALSGIFITGTKKSSSTSSSASLLLGMVYAGGEGFAIGSRVGSAGGLVGSAIVGTLVGGAYIAYKYPVVSQERIREAMLEKARTILAAYDAGVLNGLADGSLPSNQKLYEIVAETNGSFPYLESHWFRIAPDVKFADLAANDVWKYGTTKQDQIISGEGTGSFRYGKNQLVPGLTSNIIYTGNKLQVAFMEKVMIARYIIKHGDLPPGNKIIR